MATTLKSMISRMKDLVKGFPSVRVYAFLLLLAIGSGSLFILLLVMLA